jgi:hypothetical protein
MPASMPDRFGLPGQYGNGGAEPEDGGPHGTAR